MAGALYNSVSQTNALVTVSNASSPSAAVTQLALLSADGPPEAAYADVSAASCLITCSSVPSTGVTQAVMLVAYSTGTPSQSRSRAWTYTQDGHTFYVLNLGPEGTFVYDTVTNQWSSFITEGFGQWNMVVGTQWGQARVVAGDSISGWVWELVPKQVLDEGWRDIVHEVTGGLQVRSRASVGCASVRITGSLGELDEVNGATMTLNYSDDNGATWSKDYTITLTQGGADSAGGTPLEMVWRSLGSFSAPGRIFHITDTGGLLRIDGADAMLNNFDNEPQPQGGQQQ